jgi:quercetin dioxygenase-like cupin family protein
MKERLSDEYVQTDDVEWESFHEEFQTGGVQWKLLHVSPEAGSWTVLFRCPAGSTFAPHVHHGPAEGYIMQGRIEIRGGEVAGGATGRAGGYIYEAAGAIHDRTSMPDETIFMLQMVGPVGWKIGDGSQQEPQGWAEAQAEWETQHATRRNAA